LSSSTLSANNTAIWHCGTANDIGFSRDEIFCSQEIGLSKVGGTNTAFKYSILQTGFSEISSTATTPTHITASEISAGKQSSIETGFTQHGLTHVGFPKIGSDEIAAIKHSFMEISPVQLGSREVSSIHINSTQIGIIQNSSDETGTGQISLRQIDTSKFSLNQIASEKSNSTKIPFTSSIKLQQFLSSHNFDLQNRTVPLWTEFLQSPTPFNFKVEISDLPIGQLAEGTITIDSNGLGCFYAASASGFASAPPKQPQANTTYLTLATN
jgi:hypothetical protein